MSNVLFSTIQLKVPSNMVEINPDGTMSVVRTLTNKKGLTISNNKQSIQLIPDDDITKPVLTNTGKVYVMKDLKERLEKANNLAKKNDGKEFIKKHKGKYGEIQRYLIRNGNNLQHRQSDFFDKDILKKLPDVEETPENKKNMKLLNKSTIDKFVLLYSIKKLGLKGINIKTTPLTSGSYNHLNIPDTISMKNIMKIIKKYKISVPELLETYDKEMIKYKKQLDDGLRDETFFEENLKRKQKDKVEKPLKIQEVVKVAKVDKVDKVAKVDKVDKVDKVAKVAKTKKPVNQQKVDRIKRLKKQFKSVNKNMNTVIKYMNTPSKRSYKTILELFNNSELPTSLVDTIFQSKQMNDFHPTPSKCLTDYKIIVDRIKESDTILEGTAGLGFVSMTMKEINPDVNMDTIEYNEDLVDIGNSITENMVDIEQGNFFDIPDSTNYDHIFLNPPFTSGPDKHDNYYIKFIIKLIKIMHQTGSEKGLITAQILIPPPFLKIDDNKIKEGDIIEFSNLFNKMPKSQFKKYLKDEDLNEQEFLDNLPTEVTFLGFCEFATTNFKVANIFIKMNYQINKKEEEKPKVEEKTKVEKKPKVEKKLKVEKPIIEEKPKKEIKKKPRDISKLKTIDDFVNESKYIMINEPTYKDIEKQILKIIDESKKILDNSQFVQFKNEIVFLNEKMNEKGAHLAKILFLKNDGLKLLDKLTDKEYKIYEKTQNDILKIYNEKKLKKIRENFIKLYENKDMKGFQKISASDLYVLFNIPNKNKFKSKAIMIDKYHDNVTLKEYKDNIDIIFNTSLVYNMYKSHLK
jgi:hypothetical protein